MVHQRVQTAEKHYIPSCVDEHVATPIPGLPVEAGDEAPQKIWATLAKHGAADTWCAAVFYGENNNTLGQAVIAFPR